MQYHSNLAEFSKTDVREIAFDCKSLARFHRHKNTLWKSFSFFLSFTGFFLAQNEAYFNFIFKFIFNFFKLIWLNQSDFDK